jgi:hypothetical protein
MSSGRVYTWTPDPTLQLGGRVTAAIVPLLHLDEEGEGRGRLWGRYVRVRNAGAINVLDPSTGAINAIQIGDAQPDEGNDFLFEPGRGGGRLDKMEYPEEGLGRRYIQASHFGEVNTYFHLDHIASYVDGLLHELGSGPLPRVVAMVNAHHAATCRDGVRDGLRRGDRWVAFQGGHYRLLSRRYDVREYELICPDGEIHLGPGRQLREHGALAEVAGGRYRANASHNAGILYHEYGHHITRHTADLKANRLRQPDRQNNLKSALDEGICDYWAATMLGTPHIWAWQHRHDDQEVHPRSLASHKTMSDFDPGPHADPHANGTIWAAALWDLRARMSVVRPDGVRMTDLLVLKSLLLLGHLLEDDRQATRQEISRLRENFVVALAYLLGADKLLFSGAHRDIILACFEARGIGLGPEIGTDAPGGPIARWSIEQMPALHRCVTGRQNRKS